MFVILCLFCSTEHTCVFGIVLPNNAQKDVLNMPRKCAFLINVGITEKGCENSKPKK